MNGVSRCPSDKHQRTYLPCIGSETQITGCPDSLTAAIWPGRWFAICADGQNLFALAYEHRTFPAPYRVMSVTLPLSLSGLTTAAHVSREEGRARKNALTIQ